MRNLLTKKSQSVVIKAKAETVHNKRSNLGLPLAQKSIFFGQINQKKREAFSIFEYSYLPVCSFMRGGSVGLLSPQPGSLPIIGHNLQNSLCDASAPGLEGSKDGAPEALKLSEIVGKL